jgi:RimJ/RimL family protein N-acetyltransferase
MKIIETPRLLLRTWKTEDREGYFAINRESAVIEFLRGSLSLQEVDDFIVAMNRQQTERGYSLLACELKENGALLGFVGLNYTDWPSNFTPAVEIGWRLSAKYWNCGYATEAASAVLDYGFNKIGLTEILSWTVPANQRSLRVMEKIGMVRDFANDFLHPKLAPDHRLAKHVLYRKKSAHLQK